MRNNDFQPVGYLQAATNSPAGQNPDFYPAVTYVVTSDPNRRTRFSQDLIDLASLRNTALYLVEAQESCTEPGSIRSGPVNAPVNDANFTNRNNRLVGLVPGEFVSLPELFNGSRSERFV